MAVTISLVVAAPGVSPALASTSKHVAAPSRLISATATHPSREVFGFALASSLTDPTIGYPSWNFDLLSTVAFFGVHVNGAGRLVNDSGWTSWNSSALSSMVALAHQHGTKVLLTLILQDFSPNTPTMCAGLTNAPTTVSETVAQVKAKGVDGVNIDYEGLDGSCGRSDAYWAQHAMTAFVAKMRAGLGSSYYLSVDTYASSAADGYGFFDPNGMKVYVDSFFVMAYDLEYSNWPHLPISCSRFCLGPTGPLTAYHYNDTSVVQQYASLVGASKVLLGVPYYGRKSCVGSAVANAYPTSSVVADTYLDAAGEASYYQVAPGSYVVHREERSAGMERWDTWYNTTLKCTRELYWDDAVSLGKKYDLINSAGIRGVGIWNLNYGGGAPELWGALATHFAARCTGATITASPASPQGTGVRVVFTAAAAGCSSPQYRFWVQAPGGAWRIVQAYGSASSYTWTGTGVAGSYHVEADVRAGTSTAYDAVANLTYTLDACTSASLTPSLTSPQRPGVTVVLTGRAVCAGSPEYRFWVRPPGGGWSIVRDYSSAATFDWNTTGAAVGSYGLEVDVRDSGASASYEAVANMPFVLDPPCAAPSLTAAPASPQGAGASVVLTASTSRCPNPRYRFWILAPGSRWSIVQDYSPVATYTWKTAGYAPGTYELEVDVRDVSTTAAYDAVKGVADVLTTCNGARLATDKPSPQGPGASITLTGSATCAGTPEYRFWVRAPGGAWKIVRDYGTSATYTWNPTSPKGYYGLEVDVRDQGSTAVYETVANLTYLVDACTAASLSATPASPQRTGTTIVFTGSAMCAGTPQYRFWVKAPGGSWTIVQDYSTSATYTWNPTSPKGYYGLEVDVRDQGSTAVYETVANLTYLVDACTAASLSATPASPQRTGTTIVFTGSAMCAGTPQYRFWVKAPGGSWTIVQDYSTSSTFTWHTTGDAAGTYEIEVDARDAGSVVAYDTVADVDYVLGT